MAFKRSDIVSFFEFTRTVRAWTRELGSDLGVTSIRFDWGDNHLDVSFAVRDNEPVVFRCTAEDLVNREKFDSCFYAAVDALIMTKVGS